MNVVGLILLLGWFAGEARAATEFLAGADMSLLPFFESRGIIYRDSDGPQDALAILKRHGLTCVRLRLFTSSAAQAQADPYNYGNNLDYTLPLARRVKAAGLQFMLDFHYSDTWADPGHQTKPAAWANLSFGQLVQQMSDYTSNCIVAFKGAGALPEYVQVGNEITSGMLWPDGRVGGSSDTPAQWAKLSQLLNAAIQGIEGAAAGAQMPKIIVHIDRGGDWNGTQWYFDNLQGGIQFDIIGESYYPFWHGPPSNLEVCLTNAARRYQKPVMVVETGFPWAGSTNLYGIPPTAAGQVQYVAAVAPVVKGVPGLMGAGLVWWGTEYQQVANQSLAGFDRRSFFDAGGNVLPVADAMGGLVTPLHLKASLAGGYVTLSWPLSGGGMSLTTAGDLGVPAWLPVPSAVQNTGLAYYVTLPWNAAQSSFYRLQSK